jgi:tetrahydromethanopterin S-methyltransferase subunit H
MQNAKWGAPSGGGSLALNIMAGWTTLNKVKRKWAEAILHFSLSIYHFAFGDPACSP